jgi:hypothetical protein
LWHRCVLNYRVAFIHFLGHNRSGARRRCFELRTIDDTRFFRRTITQCTDSAGLARWRFTDCHRPYLRMRDFGHVFNGNAFIHDGGIVHRIIVDDRGVIINPGHFCGRQAVMAVIVFAKIAHADEGKMIRA